MCFCVFYLPMASLFIFRVFGVFFPFMLSVPVQVIAWKDSSPKWPIMCRAGHKTLLNHSGDIICVPRYVTTVMSYSHAADCSKYGSSVRECHHYTLPTVVNK